MHILKTLVTWIQNSSKYVFKYRESQTLTADWTDALFYGTGDYFLFDSVFI
jgi:hypothetical protein